MRKPTRRKQVANVSDARRPYLSLAAFHVDVWSTVSRRCTVDYLSLYCGLLVSVPWTTCRCTVHYLSLYRGLLVTVSMYRGLLVIVPWTTCHCTVDYLSLYRGLLVNVPWTTCHCTVDYLSRFAAKLVYLFLKFCVLKFCNRQTNGRTDERTDIMSVLAEAVELERQTAGFPLLT